MKNSILYRNFMITTILVIFSFVIFLFAFLLLNRSFALDEKRENINISADSATAAASALSSDGNLTGWYLRLVITSISDSTGNHIIITDPDGMVLSSSGKEIVSPYIGMSIAESVMEILRTNGEFAKMTTLGNLYHDTPYYVVAKPIKTYEDEIAGYIFVGSDCSDVTDAWNAPTSIFVLTALAILAFAIIMTYITSRYQAEPLNEMAVAAKRFAHGDFSTRVSIDGRRDEIGELSEAFNSMADSLEKSDKQRTEFIANVSHELKTPMTTIAGFADGILDGTIPYEKQDIYLETISSETKRLARLVREMLEMSRIQLVDKEELFSKNFNLTEIITRTLLTFEQKINSKGFDVDFNLPHDSIIVRGNEGAYTQVIYNLLDNAIKFSAKGTTLSISLWKHTGKAYVSIKNYGDTIPPDELSLLFDRFHKTDKSRSQDRDGVGLGLSIVKTILNNHEEDITVTSRDGVTEFIFTATIIDNE